MRNGYETDDDWGYEDEESVLGSMEEDDADVTEPCPNCGELIYDDAEFCPYCEIYLSEEDAPPVTKPWWVILGAVLALLAALYWVLGV